MNLGWIRERRPFKNEAAALALLLALFSLRLYFIWPSLTDPGFFYSDSSSHVLNDWLKCSGLLGGLRRLPLSGWLHAGIWRLYPEIFNAALALNILLSAATLGLMYKGAKAACSPGAALLTGILVISLPSFSRLALSGQPEPLYLFFVSAAFFVGSTWRNRLGELPLAAAILFILFLASYARSEAMGLFAVCAIAMGWQLRRKPLKLLVLAFIAATAVLVHFPNAVIHGKVAYAGNTAVDSSSLSERILYLPRALWAELNPSALILLLPLSGYYKQSFTGVIRAVGLIAYTELGLLWAGSWFLLKSWETERNLCAPLLLLCVPAAALISARFSKLATKPGRRLAIAVGGVIITSSWALTVPLKRTDISPEFINHARSLGVTLRPLRRTIVSSGKKLIFEPQDLSWSDFAAVSGLGNSVRLAGVHDPYSWGFPLKYDPGEKAWGMLIRSDPLKRQLEAAHGKSVKVLAVSDYTLYKFAAD